MNTLNILKDLISIDSQCNKSNRNIIDYIKKRLSGFEIKEFKLKKDNIDLYNLVVKISGKSSERPLIFVGHTDTVPISEGWKINPLNPLEKDGKIYGLGACDMKAGLACMISSVLALSEKPNNDVYLLFDSDEEGSGVGGRELIKTFSVKNAKVIVAEPTDRKIIYAQKGCLDISIEVEGKAKHSSLADYNYNSENNAVFKMLRIVNELVQYSKEIETKKDKLLGCATMNIGQINGGIAPNIVPDKCWITVSRRLIPEEKIEDVYEEIQRVVKKIEPDSKFIKLFWGETFLTNKNSEFIKEIDSKAKIDVRASWTEAALFAKYGEAVIFGPGKSSVSHSANEYVEAEDLEKFREIYFRLMNSPNNNNLFKC